MSTENRMHNNRKHCHNCGGCLTCQPCDHCNCCRVCGKPINMFRSSPYVWYTPTYPQPYYMPYTVTNTTGVLTTSNTFTVSDWQGNSNKLGD